MVWVRAGSRSAIRWAMAMVVASLGLGYSASGAFGALPDGRRIELVSPSDKNGGDIVGDGQSTIAAAGGDGVVYASRAGFAGTMGSGQFGLTAYLARRDARGWTTHGITPNPALDSLQIFVGATALPWFSDDLSSVVLAAYDLPAVGDDIDKGSNIYREETGNGGLWTVSVTEADPIGRFEFSAGQRWGVARDDSHVGIVSSTRLTLDAAAGVTNAYDWSNGSLHLAGVLPDGSVPTAGSDIQPQNYRETVSSDGSRIAFISPPTGDSQLYLRVDGSRTAWVSQSEATPVPPPVPPPSPPTNVHLQGVSPDGRHVLFTTDSRLLDADTNDGPDLYLYTDSANPAVDANLQLISSSGQIDNAVSGTPVVGMSDDASRIYFHDANSSSLFLWDQGTVRLVTGDLSRWTPGPTGQSLSNTDSDPGFARVSANGERLAFLSDSTRNNDQVHALTGELTGRHIEMYLYDASSDTLKCVSCVKSGVAGSDAAVVPAATRGTASIFLSGSRPRFLSSDGSRVFFATADALTPEDTNGLSDVYEYDAARGALALLSAGRGSDGAWFADASASGDDVFFVTAERLTGWDRDNSVDLYDARVGGSGLEPPAPPVSCVADECQGALGIAPQYPPVGSVTFEAVNRGSRTSGVRVGRLHAVFGFVAGLSVRLPGRGRVSWSGHGVRGGSRSLARAGVYRVRIVLSARARATLVRRGSYRTRVRLLFALSGHARSSASVLLSFRNTSATKGHGRA